MGPVGVFSPPADPPSPDRLELKERYILEPPSPGRLALKGIETDEEQATSDDQGHVTRNVRAPSESPIIDDSEGENSLDRPERPKVPKHPELETEGEAEHDEDKTPTHSVAHAAVASSPDFNQKDFKRLKLLSHKRSNLDSPTLREIANQNASAKRFRAEGKKTRVCFLLH